MANPTPTPIPPGVTVDWIPTPIRLDDLPMPLPDTGHILCRVLCDSAPRPFQFVYLIWIEGDSYLILEAITADKEGRFLFNDVHPATYAVLGEPPTSMPKETF